MPFATTFAGNLLRLLLANVACPNVGNAGGLQPAGAVGNIHVSLHEAAPGAAGTQATNETAYGSYARQAIPRTNADWAVVGNYLQNTGLVTFPAVTAGAGTITHVAIGYANAGAGELYCFDELDIPKPYNVGDVIEFAAGELKVKLLDA